MPLKLIPPGARKGNPCWVVRGTIDGRSYEVSAKTRDRAAARAFARQIEHEIRARRVPRPGEAISFDRAARLYAAFKDLDLDTMTHPDAKRLVKLVAELGDDAIADINQARLVDAANKLYPGLTAQTRNREALVPAAAVLHYAADNGYRDWLRVKHFREPAPRTRALSAATAAALVRAAPEGRKQLLLLWLFHQGTRISQTLSVGWSGIALAEQQFELYDKKAGAWQTFPLHPEVFELLCLIPEAERHGPLWPWRTKSGVYKWLRPFTAELGIPFTPHMGRHSRGTWLNAEGAGLKTIMRALGQKDAKSAIRYQAADVEMVRAASQKLGGLLGSTQPKARKA